ncbi:MAG: hypothetical protein ACD_65C00169G0001 [uncultured bacterium]|nr:MAG: hypothetical protein ACD_65C00169G0001 [uncultured bacterium]KKT02036.1 MAG: hypothetical protein UV80_C0006G0026 [Candidatus Peregrinibacteria bacterium GW2011_GWF2_43_17]KKT19552.1 MAG: hypothetical protein UW03_C0016G0009 [Candidatus Peregrinibacteria bacterium GW2011_GWA2_43_8]HAU40382.1 hypothetical protein [Candidatus Peregrinibacteria bacterium]
MANFAAQIQAFTCIGDETKKKIIAAGEKLSDEKRAKVITILTEGEAEKKAIVDERDTKMLEHAQASLKAVNDFKRGPLREGVKKAESIDRSSEEKSAEDLLKQI